MSNPNGSLSAIRQAVSCVLLVSAASAVNAQAPAPSAAAVPPVSLEEIVVTGSSIRGAPPVGSNLITIGADAVEDNAVTTVQQLLQTTPQIWGMNAAGQGAFGSFDASGLAVPQIHGLGGANSSSTLVVIDGHRFPTMGVRRNLADPNFIPPNAIERVEILAEGASSVYGSDAVAGVLNFITHRRYEGFGVSAQKGFGDDYDTWSASLSLGHRWGEGGAAFFYNYSDRSDLLGRDRPRTLPDQRAQGGGNFQNFNCGPTTFQPAGSSLIYFSPYTAAGVSNAQANAPCEQSSDVALIPEEIKHSMMMKLDHQVNDKLRLGGDVVYSDRTANQVSSVGTVTATVFGPGSGRGGQINPFFVAPAGTTANQGTVRWDANSLFPDGQDVESGISVFYGTLNAEYALTDTWTLSAFIMSGTSLSTETRTGGLCGACATLALNGATNSNGTLALPAIPDSTVVVNNVPLTLANALDIWNPLATNRTSPEVRRQLLDSRNYQRVSQDVNQYNVKIDGTLWSIPSGAIRSAVGLDMVTYSVDSEVGEQNNTGPVSRSSSYNAFLYERTVKSAFAEILVPLVSEEMDVPGVQSLDINISGRYDDYDEFGALKNPKFAFNWQITNGFRVRGNYAESFVAPQFSTYGPDKLTGEYGRSVDAFFGPQNGTLTIILDKYPEARTIPGCNTPGQVTCTLGTAGIPGMRLDGANPEVGPATGENWALGFDWQPGFLPGFATSITYWHTTLKDAAGSPPLAIVVNSNRFRDLLQIYPTGATPAEIEAFRGGLRQSAPLASGPMYFGLDFRNYNVYTVFVEGIDYDLRYRHQFGWGGMEFGINGTYKTRFDQTSGPGEPVFSILNKNRYLGTFPSNQHEFRADIGIEVGDLKASLAANWSGGYTFWNSNSIIPIQTVEGIPVSGGDKVDSYTSVRLNVQYDLSSMLPGDTVATLNVDNLFDSYPPFVNFNTGFDNFISFPMGRVFTVGIRTKF